MSLSNAEQLNVSRRSVRLPLDAVQALILSEVASGILAYATGSGYSIPPKTHLLQALL